jgi:putative SOS response-associated peptidase YedK
MWFKLKTGEPFVFAGLSDAWKTPDGEMLTTYRHDRTRHGATVRTEFAGAVYH